MKLSELDELIPAYAVNKERLNNFDKLCKEQNSKIKAIMQDFVVPVYKTHDYTATYSVSTRESMNEERLLEIAHQFGIPEIVKTKEYIDFDALEKAVYDGKISDEILLEMDKAKEVKEVVTLRVKKAKKKEEKS